MPSFSTKEKKGLEGRPPGRWSRFDLISFIYRRPFALSLFVRLFFLFRLCSPRFVIVTKLRSRTNGVVLWAHRPQSPRHQDQHGCELSTLPQGGSSLPIRRVCVSLAFTTCIGDPSTCLSFIFHKCDGGGRMMNGLAFASGPCSP